MISVGGQTRRREVATWDEVVALIERVIPIVPAAWRGPTQHSLYRFRETPWCGGWAFRDDEETFHFVAQKPALYSS